MPSLDWERLLLKIGPVRFITLVLAPLILLVELSDGHWGHDDVVTALIVALLLNDFIIQGIRQFQTTIRALAMRPQIKARTCFATAKNVVFLGMGRESGPHCTVYMPSPSALGPYWDEFIKGAPLVRAGRVVAPKNPGWRTPEMLRCRKRNALFLAAVWAFMAFALGVEFVGASETITLGLYGVGLMAWGVFLAREVHRRRREGAARKFVFACYQMAALSVFMGITLVL